MQISPHVKLIRLLGEGGMGEVWLAHHQRLNVEVAVKLIRADRWRGDHIARTRFEREAQAVARIDSPHIVSVLDFGISDEGMPYIVMELLRGEGLDTRLSRGTMTLPELAVVVRQVSRALQAAHDHGIVHRDIKPGNVFLSAVPDGVFVKVLDFGIAKEVSLLARATMIGPAPTSVDLDLTQGARLGTPFYMSPEQIAHADAVDGRSDIWALGVLSFQALTGQLPFLGATLAELGTAITVGRRTRASELNPSLPPAIDSWLDRMLARDPDQRYPTPMDAAAALDAIAASSTAQAYAPTRVDVTPARAGPVAHAPPTAPLPVAASGRPWLIALVAAAIVSPLLAVGAWLLLREPDGDRDSDVDRPVAAGQDLDALLRAEKIAKELRKKAGKHAEHTLRLMVIPTIGELRTKKYVYTHRAQKIVRSSEPIDGDLPPFDLHEVDLSLAAKVLDKASKRTERDAIQLLLMGCDNVKCEGKVGTGEPIWCVHVGEPLLLVCYDKRGSFLYTHP